MTSLESEQYKDTRSEEDDEKTESKAERQQAENGNSTKVCVGG